MTRKNPNGRHISLDSEPQFNILDLKVCHQDKTFLLNAVGHLYTNKFSVDGSHSAENCNLLDFALGKFLKVQCSDLSRL